MFRLLTTFLLMLFSACRLSAQTDRLVVNEIMVGNIDNFVSPAFNFDGWIELYNPTDRDIELGGLYFSNDPDDLFMWHAPLNMPSVPAHGFRVVWFDSADIKSTKVSFNLDSDGGQLFISDADGTQLVTFYYPESIERCSYACTVDGGDTWNWTANPTPEATNTTSTFASQQLPLPQPDHPSQLFTNRLSISVPIPEGATLRYTTDGTTPTATNGSTSTLGTFYISKTTSLRFRFFREGWLPSRVASRSYIVKDKDYPGPVVAVVADPKFLYDDSLGVLVDGKNGVPGNHFSDKKNWNRNWERPANFSFIDTDGQMKVNQDVDLKVSGAYSRSLMPRPFKLKGNKKHGGDKQLRHAFFRAKPYLRNRTIVMRNGGNDNNTRFKDGAMATLTQTSGAYVDLQSFEPAHEFVNGEYKGVLNMREPNNKQYPYGNYGLSTDDIEAFEVNIDSGYVQTAGTGERFDLLYELSKQADQPNVYNEIRQCLDLDEYIDYMAMYMYVGTNDWPHNNLKGFCAKDGGKWHFVSFDHDFDFNTTNSFNEFASKQTYTFQWLYNLNLQRRQEIRFVTIFLNLLKNNDFRRRFIDSYSVMGGSVFNPERCNAVIDSLAAYMEPMMQLEHRSVMATANDIKSKLNNRMTAMMSTLRSYQPMNLYGTNPQNVSLSSDTEGAELYINDTRVLTGRFKGQLFPPVKLTALPPAGWKLAGWRLDSSLSGTLMPYNSSWYYYDQGTLPDDDNWYMPDANRSSWKMGRAPLGYGKDNLSTTLSYGGDANNKFPVYYFRKAFNMKDDVTESTRFIFDYTVDDGFIIYVNGHEAGRYNMRTDGSPYAADFTKGNPDTGQMELPANLFVKGRNVVCVEVHNFSETSSDIYFAGSITYEQSTDDTSYYSLDNTIDLPTGNVVLTACFTPLTDEQRSEQHITPVRINEVSAANDSFVNDYYECNDWIELYNTTSEDISLEGMYLSDDPDDLHKYQITAPTAQSSSIPAHGHCLVWCDRLEPLSALHAPFKLPAAGAVLALTAADDSWTDYFDYPAHTADQTVGRYPDGSNRVFLMSIPTIDAANRLSSYAHLLYDKPTGISAESTDMAALTDEPTLIHAADRLIVRGASGEKATLRIYSVDGRLVEQSVLSLTDGYANYPTTHLPTALYIARISDHQSRQASCKFAVY